MSATAAFPEFMCIGAQKAGTTWLHAMLKQHPQVWMPPIKEVQYFNQLYIPLHRTWTREHRTRHAAEVFKWELAQPTPGYAAIKTAAHMCQQVNDDWYREIFSHAPPGLVRGEMTPEYSLLPEDGIRHIDSMGPQTRFLLLLRDPVARAWSHVRMFVKEPTAQNIREAVANEDVLERGMYSRIVQRWSNVVGARRLMVAFYDDIPVNPVGLLRLICDFIGVGFDPDQFSGMDEVVHKGIEIEMPDAAYQALLQSYRAELDELAETLGGRCQEWRDAHLPPAGPRAG